MELWGELESLIWIYKSIPITDYCKWFINWNAIWGLYLDIKIVWMKKQTMMYVYSSIAILDLARNRQFCLTNFILCKMIQLLDYSHDELYIITIEFIKTVTVDIFSIWCLLLKWFARSIVFVLRSAICSSLCTYYAHASYIDIK